MFFNPTSDTNEKHPDTPRRTEKPRTASDHFAQTIGVTLATGPPHLGDQVVTGKNREIRFVTCWALRIGLFWLLSLSLRILGTTSSLLGLLGSVYVPNSVSRSEVCFSMPPGRDER